MAAFFETFIKEISVFFVSMLPLVEIRGAVPVGMASGLGVWQTLLFAIAGNFLPIPFILLFMRPVLTWMKKTRFFKPVATFLERKTEKNKDKVMKYSAFGLFVFVAVPLPGTGAWTGALAASLLDMRFKYALPSILGGIIGAGLIMCFGTGAVMWLINLF